jgi:hypothetical protein
MQEMLARLVDVPMARMFIIAGIIFLMVAVLGRIEGKIEPGNAGRIGATVVGILLTASGLAMYFLEGDMIREGLRAAERASAENAKASREAAAPGRNGAGRAGAATTDPAAGADTAIKVVAATYGRNCGVNPGNATSRLARACDGHSTCDVRIDVSGLEDPGKKCDRDYVAEWRCGASAVVYTVAIPAGASQGQALRLACSRG